MRVVISRLEKAGVVRDAKHSDGRFSNRPAVDHELKVRLNRI